MLTLLLGLFPGHFPLGMITAAELIEAIPVIVSLVIIEGLLSVDNALAIAAMANHLPEKQKVNALRFGILGAYLFRGLTLAVTAWIIANQWIKWIGAAYLIYLMCSHLSQDEEGGDGETSARPVPNFWLTVLQIEIMDLSLSIDNVVAAVALSKQLWIVITGVFIGIAALRLLAGVCIKLIEKFPILGKTAFLLVGYVGLLLVFELTSDALGHPVHVGSVGKFVGICLIVAVTLVYDSSPGLKRALGPLVNAGLAVMGIFSKGFEIILWLPKQVFRVVGGLVKRRPVTAADQEVIDEAEHGEDGTHKGA